MRVLKLRDSVLVRLRDPCKLYTQNCLEYLSSALEELSSQNHLLERILLASRRSIAQQVHLFTHVLRELHDFIHLERVHVLRSDLDKISCDPLSVRIRFLEFLDRIQDYLDNYHHSFYHDYQPLLALANQHDYHSCVNRTFVQSLPLCVTLSEINSLIDSHGGQIDYHDDYLPVLNNYHTQFSFTRSLLRDATESHVLASQVESFTPALISFLRYISKQSMLPDSKSARGRFDFLEECSSLVRRLETMSYPETINFFRVVSKRVRD